MNAKQITWIVLKLLVAVAAAPAAFAFDFNDSHFHLMNYVQKGLTPQEFLKMMGDRVGRVALFGIPLQQKWDYFESGDRTPDYYLLSDAELYYYSFTDAPSSTSAGCCSCTRAFSRASANFRFTRSSCRRRLPDTSRHCVTMLWITSSPSPVK
jgi:hypothetical protein